MWDFPKKKALSWLLPLASIMAIGAIACSSAARQYSRSHSKRRHLPL